ncbi:hypothetical protein J6590_057016 [Homalodisca vitripennis]|nr:hypothetical protein J6590_057016 [Homalodisca vitripennis]
MRKICCRLFVVLRISLGLWVKMAHSYHNTLYHNIVVQPNKKGLLIHHCHKGTKREPEHFSPKFAIQYRSVLSDSFPRLICAPVNCVPEFYLLQSPSRDKAVIGSPSTATKGPRSRTAHLATVCVVSGVRNPIVCGFSLDVLPVSISRYRSFWASVKFSGMTRMWRGQALSGWRGYNRKSSRYSGRSRAPPGKNTRLGKLAKTSDTANILWLNNGFQAVNTTQNQVNAIKKLVIDYRTERHLQVKGITKIAIDYKTERHLQVNTTQNQANAIKKIVIDYRTERHLQVNTTQNQENAIKKIVIDYRTERHLQPVSQSQVPQTGPISPRHGRAHVSSQPWRVLAAPHVTCPPCHRYKLASGFAEFFTCAENSETGPTGPGPGLSLWSLSVWCSL